MAVLWLSLPLQTLLSDTRSRSGCGRGQGHHCSPNQAHTHILMEVFAQAVHSLGLGGTFARASSRWTEPITSVLQTTASIRFTEALPAFAT